MFQETSAPKTATEHSHGGDAFVDLVGGGGPSQHRMWVSKGHVLGLEVFYSEELNQFKGEMANYNHSVIVLLLSLV